MAALTGSTETIVHRIERLLRTLGRTVIAIGRVGDEQTADLRDAAERLARSLGIDPSALHILVHDYTPAFAARVGELNRARDVLLANRGLILILARDEAGIRDLRNRAFDLVAVPDLEFTVTGTAPSEPDAATEPSRTIALSPRPVDFDRSAPSIADARPSGSSPTGARRFRVALSFPGERRDFIQSVAESLAEVLGPEPILYDRFHEAEFARPDLDLHLQRLYHDESELVVVFLCAEYEQTEWCGFEWRAIRDLIKTRRSDEVMLLRFDDAAIEGLFSLDGAAPVGTRKPRAIADLILRRMGATRPPASRDFRIENHLRHGAGRLFGRDAELDLLDRAWDDPATHVLSLIAFGGVGKTSLVGEWMAQKAAGGWAGFDRVFAWTFYSGGTRDDAGGSSDLFMASALEFFGDPAMAHGPRSPWDKAARLAALVAERPTLLVLDGLEPLQHPPGPLEGTLKDPGIRALLQKLALLPHTGLCLVTSRVRVTDLDRVTATARTHDLGQLSVAAGAALLREAGVKGADAEIEQLVRDVDGHALTLTILGSYLERAHKGDVRRRDRVDLRKADVEVTGGHAFRAMAAYEKWLSEGGERGLRQLAVLRLLGLFDRPASAACLEALRAPPAIEGLTDPIVGLDEEDWTLTVSALARARLVTVTADGGLDAHPLLRSYFERSLRETREDAYKAGHSRLFDFLVTSTKEGERPTLRELQPLFQAVAHGCRAGRMGEAFNRVLQDRILQWDKFYSINVLGAVYVTLSTLGCFFEKPWTLPVQSLPADLQTWILGVAAVCLRATGRLDDAISPMREGLRRAIAQNDLRNASRIAGNLSQLELVLGSVGAAVTAAEQAVLLADRTGHSFEMTVNRSIQADALLQSGRTGESAVLFSLAEGLQAEYHLLYGYRGYAYCVLCLIEPERSAWRKALSRWVSKKNEAGDPVRRAVRRCREVEARAQATIEIARCNTLLLHLALDQLTLGNAILYRSLLHDGKIHGALGLARGAITSAVDGLRTAGVKDHLPRGLLSLALLHAVTDDLSAARADLDEAREIAEPSGMRLHLADIYLHEARIFRDRDALAKARALVDETGYHRRDAEIADADELLPL